MDTNHTAAVIAFFGIVLAFCFVVCSGLYLVGAGIYKHTRRGGFASSLQQQDTRSSLRVACLFFTFIGVLAVGLGIYDWLIQPSAGLQAASTLVSGVFFLGCAFAAYSKMRTP